MILLVDLVRRTVISASCLMVNSVGFPMFIGPICAGQEEPGGKQRLK